MCIVNEKQQALLHALRALNFVFFILIHFFAPSFVKKEKKRRKKTKFKVLCVSTGPLNLTPLSKFKILFCQFNFYASFPINYVK